MIQTTFFEAEAARDAALAAVERPAFTERACAFVLEFLRNGPASSEDVVDAGTAAGIVPENAKAWGPVFMRLARRKLIATAGVTRRRKGHASMGANVWRLA